MCPFTVRVPERLKLSGFSRRQDYVRCRRTPEGLAYCRGSARDVDLPAPLNTYALQPAIPSAGGTATTASPHRPYRQYGNVNPSAIGFSLRMSLRTRLTLIRLALIRKPWSFGEGVSRPLYRYLYLHLLFQTLQRGSRPAFDADWNAPLPIQKRIPELRRRAYTRLLSTPGPSTSELLRTL